MKAIEEDLILGEPGEDGETEEVEFIEDVADQLKDDIQICQDTFCFLQHIESDIDVIRFELKERLYTAKKKCLLVILDNIDNLYEDQDEE